MITKTLILLILSVSAVADHLTNSLWTIDLPIYGNGESEGAAYRNAEKKIIEEFRYYRARCEKQSGSFVSRLVRFSCSPYDPNSLFGWDCLVVGYGSCESVPVVLEEDVQIQELEGNQNGALDPGEKVNFFVTMKNSGVRILKDIKVSIAVSGSLPILGLQQSELLLGDLEVGEVKTLNFNGAILSSTPCGASVMLSFTAKGTNVLYRFTRPMSVGKLAAPPIVLKDSGVSMPLTPRGVSYLLREVTEPNVEIQQVTLFYRATVKDPTAYRAWLTPPSLEPIWANFVDESRTELTFSRDLTEKLTGVKTAGKWYLSGDVAEGNSAVITEYQLVIVPKIFECK